MENTINKTNTEVNTSEEVSSFALKVGIAMAVGVGIWGVACLTGGIMAVGPVALVKSLFVAIAV